MLITLAWIALLVGVVLLIIGYTTAPAARTPGIILTAIGVVLLIALYALPAVHEADYYGLAVLLH